MPRERPRLGRVLLNALTAVSLLLSVGTAGLWVRTYWVAYELDLWVALETGPRPTSFRVDSGRFTYEVDQEVDWGEIQRVDQLSGSHWRSWDAQGPEASEDLLENAGFGFQRGRKVYGGATFTLTRFPLWAPLLPMAALPSAALLRWSRRRRRRERHGLCPRCRYDLTANVSGTCPECGAPVAAPPGGGGRGPAA